MNITGGGVTIFQDPSTTTTSWPDNVTLNDVNIIDAGAVYYPNRINSVAVLINGVSQTPPNKLHIKFNNFTVNGHNKAGRDIVVAPDSTNSYVLEFNGLRLLNSNHCMDLGSGDVTINGMTCDGGGQAGEGIVVRATNFLDINNVSIANFAAGGSPYNVTPQNTSRIFVNNMKLTGSGSQSAKLNDGGGAANTHVYQNITLAGGNSTPTWGGAVKYADYVLEGVHGNLAASSLVTGSKGTFTSDSFPQMLLQSSSDPLKQLIIGYDATNNKSQIQSVWQNHGLTPLDLNPNGGRVSILNRGIVTSSPSATSSGTCTATGQILQFDDGNGNVFKLSPCQ